MNRKDWRRLRGLQLHTPAGGYDPDAVIYWGASEGGLSAARKTLDSQLFTDLKAGGLFAKFDCFWILAHEIQALAYRNAIKRAHDCTAVNAPAWVADRGSQGNGSSSYLNTNYRPNTHKVNFSLNSGYMFIYCRTNAAANTFDMGSQAAASSQRSDVLSRTTGNTAGGSINQTIGQAFTTTTSLGLTAVSRTASNVFTAFRNGAVLGSNATASTGVNDKDVYIHARNSGTAPELFSNRQLAMVGIGAGFSTAENLALFNIIESYLDAIGAGVV